MFEEHARRLENDIDGELARRTFAQFKKGTVINYQSSMYTALVDYEGAARKMLNYAGRDLNDGEKVLFTSTPDGQDVVFSAPGGIELGFIFKAAATTITNTIARFGIKGPANVVVDWGDGTSSTVTIVGTTTSIVTKVYDDRGKYTVKLTGTTPQVSIGNTGNSAHNLLECTSFGVSGLTSMASMFSECINLTKVPAYIPETVTNTSRMFALCIQFNQDISGWDVSNVTNMSDMFSGCRSFNQPIGTWDVSSVTTMQNMFQGSAFNQPLNSWDVSSVTNMAGMFNVNYTLGIGDVRIPGFNQPIGSWDVSSVTTMQNMFAGSSGYVSGSGIEPPENEFNQDISGWDVSNVTNMSRMFFNSVFDQDISAWNTGNVTTMADMFNTNREFNQDIGGWDVSNVTTMETMFAGSVFDQDIGGWNIASLTNASFMFGISSPGSVNNEPAISVQNYDNLLVGWSAQTVNPNVDLGVRQYYTIAVSGTARGVLTGAPNNWIIYDIGGI